MIKGALFDTDGVLNVDTGFFSTWYARSRGIPLERVEPFFRGPFQECMVGTRDLKQELARLLPSWDWTGGVDDFLDLWFEREANTDDRVLALARELQTRGVRVCLATNQERYRLAYLRDRQFAGVFDHVYCSAEIGAKKDDGRFFEAVVADVRSRFGLAPRELLLIDDEERNVASAARVMDAYRFTGAADLERELRTRHLL